MMDWIWKNSNLVSKHGLNAWYQYDKEAVSDGFIPDASGNGRDLTAGIDAAILTPDVRNGQPAWLFNDSEPFVWAGDVQARHIFLVMGFTEETLSGEYQGVLSGVETFDALTGIGGTDKFFDLSASLTEMQYRKGGKFFAPSNQKAPVGGDIAVIELIAPTPIFLDGIQIGQQRQFTERRGKFYFFDSLFYEHIQNTCSRRDLFAYFAQCYHVWRYRADDTPLFPFIFNRSTELDEEELAEISEAEGRRAKDRVVRYLNDQDEPLQVYKVDCPDRHQREYEAARQFLRQQRLHSPFWMEDIERDQFSKITRDPVGFSSSGAGGAFRLNYQFQGTIYDYSVVTDVPLPVEPPTDPDAPSAPPGLTATAMAGLQIFLEWLAATDNIAVAGYELRVNGGTFTDEIIDVENVLEFTHIGLVAGNTYIYQVRAYDAAGNPSAWSAIASVFLWSIVPDTIAPTVPGGLSLTAVSSSSLLAEWYPAYDEEALGAESNDDYLAGI